MTESTTLTEPRAKLDKTLDDLEQEVIEELELAYNKEDNPNQMFTAVFPYEVYIPISNENDALTEVIIRTHSEEFYSARDKQDVQFQKEHTKPYVETDRKKYMVGYVSKAMKDVPMENIELTYTGEPIIALMDAERLENFAFDNEEIE